MTDKELKYLIDKSFGLSDEQALEELEAAEKEVTPLDRQSGNFKALKERINQLKDREKPDQ